MGSSGSSSMKRSPPILERHAPVSNGEPTGRGRAHSVLRAAAKGPRAPLGAVPRHCVPSWNTYIWELLYGGAGEDLQRNRSPSAPQRFSGPGPGRPRSSAGQGAPHVGRPFDAWPPTRLRDGRAMEIRLFRRERPARSDFASRRAAAGATPSCSGSTRSRVGSDRCHEPGSSRESVRPAFRRQ